MTTTSSCGRLRIEEVIQRMARWEAKEEIVRDRTCVFCLSATHVNRAAMNKRDRFFGWMKAAFFPSFSLPCSFSFEKRELIALNISWLKLESWNYVCFVVFDHFTSRDENTDVRSVTTLRKFFNLTEKDEDVVIRTRLKVGLSIVQFCQKKIHALYPSFRNPARLREISCMRIPRILRWNLREFRKWMSNNMIVRRQNCFWEALA